MDHGLLISELFVDLTIFASKDLQNRQVVYFALRRRKMITL